MAFPSIPVGEGDIIEARVETILDGQQLMNVFHYIVTETTGTVWDDTVWTNVFEAFDTTVSDRLADIQSDEVILRENVIQKIGPDRYIALRQTAATANGQQASAAAPSGVALVARRKGIQADRTNQGRIYVGGLAAADLDGSRMKPAPLAVYAPSLVTALTSSLAPGAGYVLTPIVYNPAVGAQTITPVAFASVDDILRYQRRREVGVGS